MISRRLTKIEKIEILEQFRSGLPVNNLAKKFNCSANTINRTVKTLLTNEEYDSLKEERTKIKKTKIKVSSSENSNQEVGELEVEKIAPQYVSDSEKEMLQYTSNNNKEGKNIALDSKSTISSPAEKNDHFELNSNIGKEDNNNFEEIVPLISAFDFDTKEQKADCKSLDNVTFPEILYMLVDKKVEIEPKLICELPEWSFLPEIELQRRAILLFFNQRTAKRNCSRNQRVIKIPNTNILRLYKTYLLDKGITRLILEDELISLEN